jgi:hypothetical protein
MITLMETASTLMFTTAVRLLSRQARTLGLRMPGFRCPPRLGGVDRSLRWRAGGSATVAVRLRGRPVAAVLADMIDGVVVTNGLTGTAADEVRREFWSACAPLVGEVKVARVA